MSDYAARCWIGSAPAKPSPLARILAVAACATIIAAGCVQVGADADEPAAAEKPFEPAIASTCKADLAQRLKLKSEDIEVIKTEPVTWPDSALGIPEIGRAYTQVQTPGMRVILQSRGAHYVYTTGGENYRYGGPVSLWYCSMLYTVPVKNEPNLNNDLYQCSLMGTNGVRLLSGVSQFYPQQNGMVIVTRRTSRSSHNLLLVNAGDQSKPKVLSSAFQFGAGAIDEAQNRWAAFSRPMVGAAWEVAVGTLGEDTADVVKTPLPEGTGPGQIAWSRETLMVLVNKGQGQVCLQTSPNADKPEWKEAPFYSFPESRSFVLNKSESLDISQTTEDDKPVVEVARVWFTGDRNVVARIEGLTLKACDILMPAYAFVWGSVDDDSAAFAVNIMNGEVTPAFRGSCRDMKPFHYPAPGWQLVLGKEE